MRKIFLTAAGLMALLQAYSQKTDSSFKSRRLKLDEINLVSSYYRQDGNNAAVTGGIGSQQLTDFANVIDLNFIRYDERQRKTLLGIEMGIDTYSSASSDKIDLKANSSASRGDTRFYPSVTWSRENEKKGTTIGAGLSYSGEYDYQSFSGNLSFSAKTKDRNGEFSMRLQGFFDQVKKVVPVELRTGASTDKSPEDVSARNTFAATVSWTQIVNKQLQVMLLADVISQEGYLGLPFYRVYFQDGTVHQENLPSSRTKFPLGLRASYFAGDQTIFRAYYRFYTDSWGIRSNTMSLEIPVKITPFISVSPFYRYYSQSASKYFAPYRQHTNEETFYTSNFDMSKFNSSFFGAGIRFAPPAGVLGINRLSMIELRYGHYAKNIDMSANVVSVNVKWKS